MNTQLASINDFITHCRLAKNLSEKTISAYTIDLKQFFRFVQDHYETSVPGNISKDMLKKYLSFLMTQYKPKSMKRKIATLKSFFNYLELEEVISCNPIRKLRITLKEPLALPNFLTLHEVKTILEAADQTRRQALKRGRERDYKIALRDQTIIETLFATGIRVSELCGLRMEDVNLDTATIRVTGKGQKERIVHFGHEATMKPIKRYFREFNSQIIKCGYFFAHLKARKISPQTVRSIVKAIIIKSKLNRRITPHTFRHTFATLLMEEGVDIKYIQHYLGHSSITTTQIYTHVSKNKQREIILLKHPRLRI